MLGLPRSLRASPHPPSPQNLVSWLLPRLTVCLSLLPGMPLWYPPVPLVIYLPMSTTCTIPRPICSVTLPPMVPPCQCLPPLGRPLVASPPFIAALHRGPHPSSNLYTDFLLEEFSSMITKGQWCVLPYTAVAHLPNLRLSPLGVVPQRDRRPRTIVDYTFFGVNDDSLRVAPADAMQFGRTLHRILQRIHGADPRHGPVYISKIDISDGFYRVWLAPRDIPNLGVLMPPMPNLPPLVAFPLVLPMGWANSPPYFCATTETIADLANASVRANNPTPPHRLDHVASTPAPPELPSPIPPPVSSSTPVPIPPSILGVTRPPLSYVDVYVDDFIQLVQGTPARRLHHRRHLLHSLDLVLRPLAPSDPPSRSEPASVKKFLKGDGDFCTRKIVLGWLLDTIALTVELPPHRLQRLHEILAAVKPNQHRISTKAWHRLLGELRSMSLAIPGARGLFSTLQVAFRDPISAGRRLRLNTTTHAFLDDFCWLAHDLPTRPIRLAELVPSTSISILVPVTRLAPVWAASFSCPSRSCGVPRFHPTLSPPWSPPPTPKAPSPIAI